MAGVLSRLARSGMAAPGSAAKAMRGKSNRRQTVRRSGWRLQNLPAGRRSGQDLATW
jgi:hypothetical protein